MGRKPPGVADSQYQEYIGKRIGRVVLTGVCKFEKQTKNGIRKGRHFSAVCECGNETTVPLHRAIANDNCSCGCNRGRNSRTAHLIHGESKTKLHRVWRGMIDRCRDTGGKNQARHGGRGIRVCEEWRTYTTFRDWALSNGYKEGLEIDRENNDGHYCPSNCRWTTGKVNSNNRSDTVYLDYQGERIPLSILADRFGLRGSLLRRRLKSGWTLEKSLNTPSQRSLT